jgi:hypothetical protein
VIKLDGEGIEVGSIGIQTTNTGSTWHWCLDAVVPMASIESEGHGADLPDCQRQFKAAWERFSADPARLSDFLAMKPRVRR